MKSIQLVKSRPSSLLCEGSYQRVSFLIRSKQLATDCTDGTVYALGAAKRFIEASREGIWHG